MSQTSGVLIIGSRDHARGEFGADHVASFPEAQSYVRNKRPSVIVFGQNGADGDEFDSFCWHLLHDSPLSLWICCAGEIAPSRIRRWVNYGRLYDVIDGFDDPELERKLHEAVETYGQEHQALQLNELFSSQSQQLKRLTGDLEDRVDRRHRTLRKSLRTLEHTKRRLEVFHRALLGIHRASTIPQMEQTLNEALAATLNLAWVRVRFSHQSLLGKKSEPGVLAIEIPFADPAMRGEVLFAKPDGKRFQPEEVESLHELSEALALALARLNKLDQAETLKGQWQATFDSIPHPLCLAGADFEILKLNRAFQQACETSSFRTLIGRNSFQAFFADEFLPPDNLEAPFTFRNSRTGAHATEHYEVIGEKVGLMHDNRQVNMILLRPITDEVRFERRLVAASKLAELGTIGSSIAHELNNPLGGMLSFLQLILMDLSKTDPLYPDIKGMEHAVLRCRDIVLNLLSFARKQDLGDFTRVEAREVIDRAVKLIELQSKSKGIAIDIRVPEGSLAVLGSAGALSQALCNLLQNSIDAITDRLIDEPLFTGKISIDVQAGEAMLQIRVTDNGPGIRPDIQSQIFNPLFTTRDPSLYGGMGLTTAFTIINEHQGTLEILSQTAGSFTAGGATVAIIALPRI